MLLFQYPILTPTGSYKTARGNAPGIVVFNGS